MSQFDEIIFGKKTTADLLKEIYDNKNKKEKEISGLIDQLKGLILNIGDALLLAPLIQKYIDLSLTNNDHLIKMVQIIQKATARISAASDDADKDLTPEEKEALLKEWDDHNMKVAK